MTHLLNGERSKLVSAEDRGLHYGDGVFETMVVADGRARYFLMHMQRLAEGCKRLGIEAPESDLIEKEIEQLCAYHERSIVKLIVTRGSGKRGYMPPAAAEPTRLVLRYDWPEAAPDDLEKGVVVRVCGMRLGINPRLAGIKHLNRLEQILARAEWSDPLIREGVMLDTEGFVVEGVHSNIFIVSEGLLKTPLLDRCGVAGITRQRILELAAEENLTTTCCRVTMTDLLAATEVFLTNSVSGIVPVRRIDQQSFRPGNVTKRLGVLLDRDKAE